MQLIDRHIIVVSNEVWGDVWYSKHNYAYELSKRNKVIFMDPTTRWEPGNLLRPGIELRKITPTLSVLRYRNFLPSLNHPLLRWNNTVVSARIKRTLERMGFRVELFLSFDPSRLFRPALLAAERSLFIAVDHYDFTVPGERYLYTNVQGIVTISQKITQDFERFNKPMLTIGHAISSEEFEAEPVALPYTDFGLYIGTIDARLDVALVLRMVKENPTVPFVFIGRFDMHGNTPMEDLLFNGSHANVHYLGVKPFKELKAYIAASRFCLAPMDISRRGNDISHHKIFQYLALGKPVFSTVFSEYAPAAHLLYMRNDPDELLHLLGVFLAKGEAAELSDARIAYARERTYEAIFDRIEGFVKGIPQHADPS